MRCFLLILVFFQAHAGLQQRELTPQQISGLILPQLRSLHQDFYQVLLDLGNFPQLDQKTLKRMNDIQFSFYQYQKKCPKLYRPPCESLRIELIELLTEQNFSITRMLYSHQLTPPLDISRLYLSLPRVTSMLDQGLNFLQYTPPSTTELQSLFHLIFSEWKLVIMGLAPMEWRKDFYLMYTDLIYPLENSALLNGDIQVLKTRLNEMNSALNQFSFSLTKLRKINSAKAQTQLVTIHQRWNSILRVILK